MITNAVVLSYEIHFISFFWPNLITTTVPVVILTTHQAGLELLYILHPYLQISHLPISQDLQVQH